MSSPLAGDDYGPDPTPTPVSTASAASTVRTAPALDIAHISASDSSDEGVRMSPAAARRFARRNFRRTAATPDLVTSLIRPPSPEALYIARDAHGRLGPDLVSRATAMPQSHSYGLRHYHGNRDHRSGPLLPPHPSSLEIPKKYGGDCIFDMYALSYVSEPDPNLLCPICHDPLVDPVTTPCDHTFCYRCLRRSIASSPSGTACPIDRELLSWVDCFSAARLVRTQLNSLIVKCPYQGRGCDQEMRRESVENHTKQECRYREFTCPDTKCDKKLRSKPKDEECHHRETACSLCQSNVDETDQEVHLLACQQAKTRCEGCWSLVCRAQLGSHRDTECDGVEIACPHKDVGCPVRAIRGEMSAHSLACAFHPDTASGVVIRNQRDIIQAHADVGAQLRDLLARQDETTRRVDELANNQAGGGTSSAGNRGRTGDTVFSDNRTMQDLDAGFEEVHQNLTHLEARQSMWTLNQVMPIREEVTELRNNINMIRMHVNWLLNRSREEGRIRAANNTGPASATAAAAAAAIRRSSSTDGAPMLPERRRSSGTDMDVPRL